jgi:hypothetical protein
MQIKFYCLSKPEIEFLKDNCNFSEDESILLYMASMRCSDIQIAEKLNVSTSCVTKRKKKLLSKINDFLGGIEKMVTVYINGKPITADEMKNYKLQITETKNTIEAKLTKRKN